MKKQKKALSPEAAKILEQYRNAGKPQPAPGEGSAPAPAENGVVPPRPAAPPPSATRQRSGVRGK